VLAVPQVNADHSFFELGGHSLLATQVVMEIEQAFGHKVPLNVLFKHRTLERLSRYLDDLPPPPERAERTPRRHEDEDAPLSHAQRRLWYGSQLTARGLEYKILKVLELEGRLNVAALAQAVEHIVYRHEALRTCFTYSGGKLVQQVMSIATFHLDFVDLRGLAPAAAEAAERGIQADILERPFDLEQGPLMRITLVRSSDSRAQLIFDAHHIVIDGWSVGILVSELNSLSRSFSQGRPSGLAPLPTQYREYALAERERVDQGTLAEQLAYWRARLAGLPRLEFPPVRAAGLPAGPDGEIDFALDDALRAPLSALCRELEITPFMFFTAVYYVLLAMNTGARDVAIGTDVANRDSRDHAGLIGFFSNQLVLRVAADDDVTFAELCRRTRETAEEAFAHKDLPYDALVRDLREDGRARDSLFRAKFVFHHTIPDIAIPGIRTRFVEITPHAGKFDLLLNVQEGADGFSGKVEYSGEVLDEPAAARLADQFRALCGQAAAAPRTPLRELIDATAAAERERSRRELETAREQRRSALRGLVMDGTPRPAGDAPA
jgi:acyl carrier protein